MTAQRLLSPFLALTLLSACATTAPSNTEQAQTSAASAANAPVQLAPKDLNTGECALFLFTRDAPRRFVLFSRAASNQAHVIIENQEVTLPLTAAGGDIFGQFLTQQTFANGTETLVLSLTPGEIIENGQRIPVASLTRTMADGWDVITPLQGVRACQPDQTAIQPG